MGLVLSLRRTQLMYFSTQPAVFPCKYLEAKKAASLPSFKNKRESVSLTDRVSEVHECWWHSLRSNNTSSCGCRMGPGELIVNCPAGKTEQAQKRQYKGKYMCKLPKYQLFMPCWDNSTGWLYGREILCSSGKTCFLCLLWLLRREYERWHPAIANLTVTTTKHKGFLPLVYFFCLHFLLWYMLNNWVRH